MQLTNTAEGGTSGITVTTANSGGDSGDAWDIAAIDGTSTLTFSSAQMAHGDLGYEFVPAGAAGNGVTLGWSTSLGASTSEHYARLYLRLSANPSSNLVLVHTRGDAGQAYRIVVTTAGVLSLRNASNVEVAASTTAVTTGAWIRIEWHAVITSGTTGDLTVRLFNTTESLLSTETVEATGLTMQTELNNIRVGDFVGWSFSATAFYLDSIEVNDIAFPGPVEPDGDVVYGIDSPIAIYPNDDTQQLNLTNDSYAAGTPELSGTFIAPTSGRVTLTVGGGLRDNGGASDDRVFLSPQVYSGVDTSGTEQLAPSVTFRGFGSVDTTSEFMYASRSSLLTGLVPGAVYFVRLMHVVSPSGASPAGTADINVREIIIEGMP